MTEEIIIDGVQVSKCRHFKYDGIKKPICRSGGCVAVYRSCLCEDNADCDFKQLQRLEQENKELKAYKDVNEDFKKAWDELNKKYTEVLKLAKENADSNEYCLQELEQENKELKSSNKKICEDWEKEIKVYWNALEEIREIADKCKECLNEDDDCGCDYLRIKRRIDEVLGNENN